MELLSLLHWTFGAVALSVAVLTKTIKRALKNLPENKWIAVIKEGHFISAFLGFCIGWIPNLIPSEIITYGFPTAIYYAASGIISLWFFSLISKVFREYLPENIKSWLGNKFGKKS